MIDTSAVLPAGSPAATPTPPAASTTGLASDFQTFLKMLTAQARYQDPLEPIDSTEFSSQLAQFSMVEQQVKTNTTLTALAAQMGTANMASLAGWVGMEARAVAPAYFDGTPVVVSPNPATTADQAYLVVRDASGAEIQRASIPVSTGPIEWAGVDEDGTPFETGIYSFSVESFGNGELILSEPAEVYGRITEAQVQDGDVILILRGGQAIPSSSVTALRQNG